MDWSNERYVRLYVRVTVDETLWPWQARAVWPQIVRRADRSGVIDIGKHEPAKAIAALIAMPLDVVTTGLEALITDTCLVHSGDQLVVRNHMAAQEAVMSDALRQRESRAKKAMEKAASAVTPSHDESRGVTICDEESRAVTNSDGQSQIVTECHAASRAVTPSVPSVLCLAEEEESAAAGLDPDERTAALRAARWLAEITTRQFDADGKWGSALTKIWRKPPAERERVESTVRASAGLGADPDIATPTHLIDHWHLYAAGKEPGQRRPAKAQPDAPKRKVLNA